MIKLVKLVNESQFKSNIFSVRFLMSDGSDVFDNSHKFAIKSNTKRGSYHILWVSRLIMIGETNKILWDKSEDG